MRRNKYGAKRCEIDGHKFDSLLEGRRYQELKLLQRAGQIHALTVHPRYELTAAGKLIAIYESDFAYLENGKSVVEDVKGVRTALYRLKRKWFEATHPQVEFREITAADMRRRARRVTPKEVYA